MVESDYLLLKIIVNRNMLNLMLYNENYFVYIFIFTCRYKFEPSSFQASNHLCYFVGNNSTQQTEVIGDISSSSRDPSENGEQSGDCSAGERSFSDSFK